MNWFFFILNLGFAIERGAHGRNVMGASNFFIALFFAFVLVKEARV